MGAEVGEEEFHISKAFQLEEEEAGGNEAGSQDLEGCHGFAKENPAQEGGQHGAGGGEEACFFGGDPFLGFRLGGDAEYGAEKGQAQNGCPYGWFFGKGLFFEEKGSAKAQDAHGQHLEEAKGNRVGFVRIFSQEEDPEGIKEGGAEADDFSCRKGKAAAFHGEEGNTGEDQNHGGNHFHSRKFPSAEGGNQEDPEDGRIFQKSHGGRIDEGKSGKFTGDAQYHDDSGENSRFQRFFRGTEDSPVKEDSQDQGGQEETDAQEFHGRHGIHTDFGK